MVLKMHEKISQLKEKRKRDAMIVDSDSVRTRKYIFKPRNLISLPFLETFGCVTNRRRFDRRIRKEINEKMVHIIPLSRPRETRYQFPNKAIFGLAKLLYFSTAATTRNIEVWLPNDSKDREFLLKVRGCQFSHEELNKIFTEQVEHVEKALESYIDDQLDNQKRLDMCKDWYFHLRKTYEDNSKSYLYRSSHDR
jgi:hypothetical protein